MDKMSPGSPSKSKIVCHLPQRFVHLVAIRNRRTIRGMVFIILMFGFELRNATKIIFLTLINSQLSYPCSNNHYTCDRFFRVREGGSRVLRYCECFPYVRRWSWNAWYKTLYSLPFRAIVCKWSTGRYRQYEICSNTIMFEWTSTCTKRSVWSLRLLFPICVQIVVKILDIYDWVMEKLPSWAKSKVDLFSKIAISSIACMLCHGIPRNWSVIQRFFVTAFQLSGGGDYFHYDILHSRCVPPSNDMALCRPGKLALRRWWWMADPFSARTFTGNRLRFCRNKHFSVSYKVATIVSVIWIQRGTRILVVGWHSSSQITNVKGW